MLKMRYPFDATWLVESFAVFCQNLIVYSLLLLEVSLTPEKNRIPRFFFDVTWFNISGSWLSVKRWRLCNEGLACCLWRCQIYCWRIGSGLSQWRHERTSAYSTADLDPAVALQPDHNTAFTDAERVRMLLQNGEWPLHIAEGLGDMPACGEGKAQRSQQDTLLIEILERSVDVGAPGVRIQLRPK